jgi:hypothetical protein
VVDIVIGIPTDNYKVTTAFPKRCIVNRSNTSASGNLRSKEGSSKKVNPES